MGIDLKARWVAPVAVLIFVALILNVLVHRPHSRSLLVYLPAAGKKVWEKVIPIFERREDVNVEVIYGSSGRLLEQAYLSERGDLLGSATPPYMEKAIEYGIVYKDTVKYVACMLPAILIPRNSNITSIEDLVKGNYKIAMCDPRSCAVGRYFKYMLEKMNLWDLIKPHIVVYTSNFAKLVSVLLMGNVDAALGWNVAAYWYPDRIKSINLKPLGPYKPCIVVAVLKSTKDFNLAKKFEEFLTSKYVKNEFEKMGYKPPEVIK